MKTSYIRKLIKENNLMKFYKGKDWMKLRQEALERDHYECQVCKSKGKYRAAECVHHMKEVKQHPELALTLNNLQSLCNQCHNDVHDRLDIHKPKFVNEERW
jgi:5-methylcytosine-specific restriction enzyme A